MKLRKMMVYFLIFCIVILFDACGNYNDLPTNIKSNNTTNTNSIISPTENFQTEHQISEYTMNTDHLPFDGKGDYSLNEYSIPCYTTSISTLIFEKASATANIIAIYGPGEELQVLGDSPLWYYISVDGITGYTPFHSLAFNQKEVPNISNEYDCKENMIVSVVEKEVNDGELTVRFKNLSENEQVLYNFLVLPYDQDNVLLPEQMRVLSADMYPYIQSDKLSMEGLIWKVEDNICTIDVCLLEVVYWDEGYKNWYNAYSGDWLLDKLEEAGFQ